MIKYILVMATIAISINNTEAQASGTPKSLVIGDRVPDILFEQLLNYTASKASISDFEGKVIILDFWATWCGPCVGGMPKLDSLQKAFGSDIFILLSTVEKKNVVENFLKRRNKTTKLVIKVEDRTLYKYFPHTIIPHTVIIGKDGKVAAITNAEAVTADAITRLKKGIPVSFPVKKDLLDYSFSQSLEKGGDTGNAVSPLFRSLVLPSLAGAPSAKSVITKDEQPVGFKYVNATIPHLFMYALDLPWPYMYSRLVFENLTDSNKYIPNDRNNYGSVNNEWAVKNLYCYEQIFPGASEKEQREIMFRSLQSAFKSLLGLQVTAETRKLSCFVLVCTDSTKIPKTRFNDRFTWFDAASSTSMFRTVPAADIAYFLETTIEAPVIDNTGLSYALDLAIPDSIRSDASKGNLASLKTLLNKNGLDIVTAQHELDAVVFREEKK